MSSILEAASAGVRDMADGTLRITIEFEPRFASMAYALFGQRGTPLAIAALKPGHAAKSDAPAPPPIPLGRLALLAVQLGKLPAFRAWAAKKFNAAVGDEDDCADLIRSECGVESRRNLDGNEVAAEVFHEQFRKPWIESQKP